VITKQKIGSEAGSRRVESRVCIERMRPHEFDGFWAEISEALDRIAPIWAERWTKEAMYSAVMSENWQAWSAGTPPRIDVIVLTHVVQYPNVRALQALLCFGKRAEEVISVGEAFFEKEAVANGCGLLEIVGRRGWGKLLPNFREDSVVFSKRIGEMVEH
jgi:hypothetical protein